MERLYLALLVGAVMILSGVGCASKPFTDTSNVPKSAFKSDTSKMSAAEKKAVADAITGSKPNLPSTAKQ